MSDITAFCMWIQFYTQLYRDGIGRSAKNYLEHMELLKEEKSRSACFTVLIQKEASILKFSGKSIEENGQ